MTRARTPIVPPYGRAKRTNVEFAERHGLAGRVFEPQAAGVPSTGAKGFLDHAVAAVRARVFEERAVDPLTEGASSAPRSR